MHSAASGNLSVAGASDESKPSGLGPGFFRSAASYAKLIDMRTIGLRSPVTASAQGVVNFRRATLSSTVSRGCHATMRKRRCADAIQSLEEALRQGPSPGMTGPSSFSKTAMWATVRLTEVALAEFDAAHVDGSTNCSSLDCRSPRPHRSINRSTEARRQAPAR